MEEQKTKHTPGPYGVRVETGAGGLAIHSEATGERVAYVLSRESGDSNAPGDEAALYNAALFRSAPRLRESLQTLLGEAKETVRPETRERIGVLLAEIEAGAGKAVQEERLRERRLHDEALRERMLEMSRRDRGQDHGPADERERGEPEQSFGW